jgi:hypothetical protein
MLEKVMIHKNLHQVSKDQKAQVLVHKHRIL